jgi:hypothetical protein
LRVGGSENWSGLKTVTLNKVGRFRAELPAGPCYLALYRSEKISALSRQPIIVIPGQKINDVTLEPSWPALRLRRSTIRRQCRLNAS